MTACNTIDIQAGSSNKKISEGLGVNLRIAHIYIITTLYNIETLKSKIRTLLIFQSLSVYAFINTTPVGILSSTTRILKKFNVSFIFHLCLPECSFSHFFYTLLILKKINASFIVHYCLGKYSFCLNTFSVHIVFRKKLTFHSFYVYALVNTVSIWILSSTTRILKKHNVSFIVRFYPCKYSFSPNTFSIHLLF